MTESEERRRQLLRQSRRMYHDSGFIPAVHPHCSNAYHSIYPDNTTEQPKSSFFLRFFIGVLCFICYVWIDAGAITPANVSSDKIVNQIEKQQDLWYHTPIKK